MIIELILPVFQGGEVEIWRHPVSPALMPVPVKGDMVRVANIDGRQVSCEVTVRTIDPLAHYCEIRLEMRYLYATRDEAEQSPCASIWCDEIWGDLRKGLTEAGWRKDS